MDGARKRQVCELLRRGGALAAARRLRAGLLRRPALLILGYHRVAEAPPPFSPLAVSPAAFEEQIAHFARRCDVWSLAQAEEWRRGARELVRDTVVITFDDGYADNHVRAAPILERHGVPATFFVTTGPLRGAGGGLWWDDLRHGLEAPGALAAIAASAIPAPVAALARAYAAADGGRRPAIARDLLAVLRRGPEHERAAFVTALAGAPAGGSVPDAEFLTPAQVADLARRGFDIGAHGVTHASLPALGAAALAAEIEGSLAGLRALGIEPAAFAYPFGDAGEPGGAVERALAAAGVGVAVTTEERAVRRGDAPLRLPRKVVPAQPTSRLLVRLERLAWGP